MASELRAARPSDAAAIAPLIVEAMGPLALELAGASSFVEAAPVFEALFAVPGHRYSYEHVQVMEEGGAVIAALLAYPGRDEAALAAASHALLRQRDPARVFRFVAETRPDEFYLDALAVAPAQRGRGLAARLIQAACAQASMAGFTRAGLLVDEAKPGVKRLYERLHFVADGCCTLAGHVHGHLTKILA